jgi:hypothetical protein
MENTFIQLDAIRTDGGTQPRAAMNVEAVDDYTEAMSKGDKFPPVVVFYDGADSWLADGFHRVQAARQAGLSEIASEVHQGTRQDAQWYSCGANRTNGLRRTNKDKQRAVKAALAHPNAAEISNGVIAAYVGVTEATVRNWREKSTSQLSKLNRRRGRDGRSRNTANIGARRSPVSLASPVDETMPAKPERRAVPSEGAGPPAAPAPATTSPVAEHPVQAEEVPAVAAKTESTHAEATTAAAERRMARAKKIEHLGRLNLAFLECTAHLAHLVIWLGETHGQFEQAESLLAQASENIAVLAARIEAIAVAADPLNASRLGIDQKKRFKK